MYPRCQGQEFHLRAHKENDLETHLCFFVVAGDEPIEGRKRANKSKCSVAPCDASHTTTSKSLI